MPPMEAASPTTGASMTTIATTDAVSHRALLQHQNEATADLKAAFATSDRATLVSACGSGKTLTSQRLAESYEARLVLVGVPRLSLMSQHIESFRDDAPGPITVVALCSEDGMHKPQKRGEDEDDAEQLSAWDLQGSATFTRTQPQELAEHIERALDDGGETVYLFATYLSADAVVAAQTKHGLREFDMVIADEAHWLTASAVPKPGDVAFVKSVQAKRRLFVTATPRVTKGDPGKGRYAMNDEALFGLVAHVLTFGSAIDRAILTPYQLRVPVLHTDMYQAAAGDEVFFDGEAIDAQELAAILAIERMLEQGLRRFIVFHQTIVKSEAFAERAKRIIGGKFMARHIDGGTNSDDRKQWLSDLAAEEAGEFGYLISNCFCLAEGIDVKSLDAVVFAHPQRGQIRIAQSVGRAIRKSPGKKRGYIVIPVALTDAEIDDLGSDQSAEAVSRYIGSKDKRFSEIAEVLNALGEHDQIIQQVIASGGELGSKRQSRGPLVGAGSPTAGGMNTPIIEGASTPARTAVGGTDGIPPRNPEDLIVIDDLGGRFEPSTMGPKVLVASEGIRKAITFRAFDMRHRGTKRLTTQDWFYERFGEDFATRTNAEYMAGFAEYNALQAAHRGE